MGRYVGERGRETGRKTREREREVVWRMYSTDKLIFDDDLPNLKNSELEWAYSRSLSRFKNVIIPLVEMDK